METAFAVIHETKVGKARTILRSFPGIERLAGMLKEDELIVIFDWFESYGKTEDKQHNNEGVLTEYSKATLDQGYVSAESCHRANHVSEKNC